MRVLFFEVKTPGEKVRKIPEIAAEFFTKNEKLLIYSPESNILQYIDDLLWKSPEESFLPHQITSTKCQDMIILTDQISNPNEANSIFNLSKDALLSPMEHISKIYEFDDHSDPQKKELSEKRYAAYRKAGFAITSL